MGWQYILDVDENGNHRLEIIIYKSCIGYTVFDSDEAVKKLEERLLKESQKSGKR